MVYSGLFVIVYFQTSLPVSSSFEVEELYHALRRNLEDSDVLRFLICLIDIRGLIVLVTLVAFLHLLIISKKAPSRHGRLAIAGADATAHLGLLALHDVLSQQRPVGEDAVRVATLINHALFLEVLLGIEVHSLDIIKIDIHIQLLEYITVGPTRSHHAVHAILLRQRDHLRAETAAQVLVTSHRHVLPLGNKQVARNVVGEIEHAVILHLYQVLHGLLMQHTGAVTVLEGNIAILGLLGIRLVEADFLEVDLFCFFGVNVLHHEGTASQQEGKQYGEVSKAFHMIVHSL